MDMSVKAGGLEFKNPVLTASGTFGYGLEFMPYGDLSRLGGIVVKGLSLEPRQGNPGPRIVETSCGLLNAIGLENIGVEAFIRDKLSLLPWDRTAVIVNLYARESEEFGELAAVLADQEKVAGLEVNVSCPNVRAGGVQFGQDPALVGEVTRKVKDRAGSKPVMVKLSPNVTDITVLARAAEENGADLLSLINTLSGMAVDIRTRRPCLANTTGGLSGPAIKPVALKMVHAVCRAVKIPVIGLGGITTAEDILEYLLVGARAVQVGSGNFQSPDKSFQLVRDLENLTGELGIASWEEYRGSLEEWGR
ncbi:MAG: dihydroorotate dehydrogenase [Desulfohalobiaceae bacterium]|nr:dihydroorotate dehydrogenase [Desulfohalobiaceae bacterium]